MLVLYQIPLRTLILDGIADYTVLQHSEAGRMKIYCNLDVDTRNFEGRTQLAKKIVSYLQEQGFQFVKEAQEADMFHFHSSGVGDSYQAYKLGKKFGKPVIYSLYSNATTSLVRHPINFLVQKIFLQKTATKFLPSYSAAVPLQWRAFFLKKLNTIIVPSHYLKDKLFENTRVIPFGIDTEKFKPLSPKSGKIIKVAYFGHASVFKGLNDFVLASKKFSDRIETHIFMTERFEKVDRYIKKRNDKIKIQGFIEDIVQAYNDMDIIVLPYRMEIGTVATPLVLLEAMACGKAIVTTNFEFLRKVVGNAAKIVKKFSPSSIAKAVNALAENEEERKELGLKARIRAVERYSAQKMLEGYLLLYKEYEKN